MRTNKGQTSAEFLIVFAISMVVIIFVFFMVYQQIIGAGVQRENADAERTVAELSSAIRDVYTQGEGASRKVTITLPSTYDRDSSGIVNDSLLLKTRETYRVENFDFPVGGTLPQAPGTYDVIIVSRGNSVYVGGALFKITPSLAAVIVNANQMASALVTVTSLTNETITINGSLYWPNEAVSLTVPNLNFQLGPYEEVTLNLTFIAGNSTGGYPGSIVFIASGPQFNDTQSMGVYAETPGIIVEGESDLVVYPLSWYVNSAPGQNASDIFLICANGPQALYNITFTPSSGDAGDWVAPAALIDEIPVSSCVQKNLSLSVPLNQSFGSYFGNITVSDGTRFEVINVTVQVAVQDLNINTLIWDVYTGPGGQASTDFTICAANVQIDNITFSPAGTVAPWLTGLTKMGPLAAGTCEVRTINMSVPTTANPGTYTGNITIVGDSLYAAVVNVTAYVRSQNITVSPETWYVGMKIGQALNETFMVCSTNVSITLVKFIPSAGAPGSWVLYNSSKGPLNAGSCFLKKLGLSIPANATPGIYNGTIIFSGDGTYNYSMPLDVFAKPPYSNITLSFLNHTPRPAYAHSPSVTITGYANSTAPEEGKNITGCMVVLDDEFIYDMQPLDGAFDSTSENLTINLGQLSRGPHRAVITCMDTDEVESRQYNYTFNVYKPLLFVFYFAAPTSGETDWLNWITNKTGLGVDTAYSSELNLGTVDENEYNTVIFEEWDASPPGTLKAQMNLYVANNRTIVFLGNALQRAPSAFGASGGSGNSEVNTALNILNDTHYIISGYTLGSTYTISGSQLMWRFTSEPGAINLGELSGSPGGKISLAQYGRTFYYGPTNTTRLNGNGTTLANRTFWYAYDYSQIVGEE